ncbi:MAG: lytic transglycosylase domain-containing protein [Armatimonadia bacterium]
MLVHGLSATLGRVSEIQQKLKALQPSDVTAVTEAVPAAPGSFASAVAEAESAYRPTRARKTAFLSPTRFDDLIRTTAAKYGVDPDLIHAVVQAESGYDPDCRSGAGAQGLMQLMPGTARSLGVSNAFDPSQNLDGGVRYLRQQIQRFGEIDLALAAYNAGPGAVQAHDGIPPYRETQAYVKRVMQNLWQRKGD